jgi:hypothetical protein
VAVLDRPRDPPAISLDELVCDRVVLAKAGGVLCGTSLTLQDVQADDLAGRAPGRGLCRASNKRRH